MMRLADTIQIRRLRRLAGATWNWWTAAGLIVLLVLAIAPRLAERPPVLESLSVAKVSRMSLPVNDALGPASEAAPAPAQPKLKLNTPKGINAQVGSITNAQAVNGVVSARHLSRQGRQMARKATLNLIVGDVGRAIASLESLSRALDGDVTKLNDERPATPNEHREANLTLVVPSDRFDGALARVAKIGGVRSQSVTAEDVGDQIVDDEARLRNLRRTETDMLKIMDRSGRVGEVLAVENQLSDVREQIEKLDAEAQALKARVVTSTIDVHLEEELRTIGAEPNAASQLGDAWAAAWHASREAALGLVARLFFLIAFAPYWLIAIAIGAVIVAQARRRLRSQSA
jgi:hypothetical protein